jgi:hypothetical protein
MDPGWVVAAVSLFGLISGLAVWSTRGVWRTFRKTDQFLEDWNGREASPGHVREPGVMERLAALEHSVSNNTSRLDGQDTVLAAIKAELTYNSGHSVKDMVRNIQARLPPAGNP